MPSETTEVIRGLQWTFTFIAIAWSLDQLRKAQFKPAVVLPDGSRLMKMSKALGWIAYGSITFWVALMVLSTLYPGKTKPDDLVWAQCVFAFFAVLSAALAHTYHTADVVWDEASISGSNWYGKKLSFAWEDVIDCAYNESMQAITVKGRDGQTIWLTEYLSGLDEFVEHLQRTRRDSTLFKQGRYRLPPMLK